MQKYGNCELCGEQELLADYGLDDEFICVNCALDSEMIRDHIADEMVRRHGRDTIIELFEDVRKRRMN